MVFAPPCSWEIDVCLQSGATVVVSICPVRPLELEVHLILGWRAPQQEDAHSCSRAWSSLQKFEYRTRFRVGDLL